MNEDVYASWGRKVKAAREALQISQRRLAEICDLDTGTISRIERGVLPPRDRVKWKLAGALGRSIDDLFPYPAERPPFPEPAVDGEPTEAEAVGQ